VIRNRTWDAGRATVGPHVAVTSGQRRSLRVSPTGVCPTAATGRGILPSWSCEFDSRHPLQSISPSGNLLSGPGSGFANSLMRASGHVRATADLVLARSASGEHQRSRGPAGSSHGGKSERRACCRGPFGTSALECSHRWRREIVPVWRRSWKWNPAGKPASTTILDQCTDR
jgi:hypothetical protein